MAMPIATPKIAAPTKAIALSSGESFFIRFLAIKNKPPADFKGQIRVPICVQANQCGHNQSRRLFIKANAPGIGTGAQSLVHA